MTDEDYPEMVCPKCGIVTVDMDGFGVLACEHCGYCTHPSSSGPAGGPLTCGICGTITAPKTEVNADDTEAKS